MAMQSGFIKRIRDIMRMDAGINGDAQRIEQMVWMLFLKVYDAKEDDWELNEDNYESIIPEDLRWRNWAKADSNGHAMTGDKLLNFVNNTLFPVLKGNDIKEGDTIVYEGIKVAPDTPIKKAIVKSTFEDANNYMKDGVYLRQVIDVIDEIEFDDVKESHAFGFVYEESLNGLVLMSAIGRVHQDDVELIRVRIVQQIILQRVHVIDVRNLNVMQQHIGYAEQIRERLFLDSVNAVIKLLLSRSIGYLLG